MGIAVIFVMGIFTFYTCYLTVRTTSTHPARPGVVLDFSDLCEYYLGKPGKWICFCFSIIAFLGALIVFWVSLGKGGRESGIEIVWRTVVLGEGEGRIS